MVNGEESAETLLSKEFTGQDEIVRRISREHPGGSLVTILKNMRWQAATEGASMVFLLDLKDSLVSPKDIWTMGLNENL